ncbi:N-acetylmuramoyl-L-alanine amidase [Lysobacter fragariae]
MRVNGATVQKILLGTALLSALAWNLVHASEINGLRVAAGPTGTRAEVALDTTTEFKLIRLSAPERLVVDLPESHQIRGLPIPGGAGIVKSVRIGQPQPGVARIVFDLAQPVAVLKPRIEQGAKGPHLVLEWPGDFGPAAPVAPKSTAPDTASQSASTQIATTHVLPSSANGSASQQPATTTAPPIDSSAESSAATTRLISELAARSQGQSANVPPSAVGTGAAGNGGTPGTAAVAPTTRIATGIPTHIATGVPAQLPSSRSTGTSATEAPASTQADATPAPVRSMRDIAGMRPLVIAIDAGHGGQDPGASGQGGKREKDVTLAIARELGRQINATPGLKAYLTRDTDVFIPLNRRAQLARAARADIFVSIHADAAENRSASGSSVYVLSLKGASSQRARWLADKENASDMIGGVRLNQTSSTLTSVLLDLTQSGQMKASEDAASHVLSGLGRLGRNHKPQIERANFAVLRTSDMPAMLVETAFISNPDEERRLTDPARQREIARAVLDGVNSYFLRQPPPGTMYAARASADMPDKGAGGGSP